MKFGYSVFLLLLYDLLLFGIPPPLTLESPGSLFTQKREMRSEKEHALGLMREESYLSETFHSSQCVFVMVVKGQPD